MLDRLVLLAAANEWPVYHQLASRLKRMPEGAFRRPDPRVERLLSSTEALVNGPGLVSRLADRGPSESERLFSFVRERYAPASKNGARRRSEIAEAALRGSGCEARATSGRHHLRQQAPTSCHQGLQ